MTTSTRGTNIKMFAFIAALAFELLNRQFLFVNKKR